MNFKLLLTTFFAAAAVAAVHLTAIEHQLYFHLYWFDMLAHFLGGVFVALAAAVSLHLFGTRVTLFTGALAACVAGIGWEIFEYISGFPTSVWMSYVADTSKDLIIDVCGGVVGAYIARCMVE